MTVDKSKFHKQQVIIPTIIPNTSFGSSHMLYTIVIKRISYNGIAGPISGQ
jgi:hypothetical protein